jgi:hypothetical protein
MESRSIPCLIISGPVFDSGYPQVTKFFYHFARMPSLRMPSRVLRDMFDFDMMNTPFFNASASSFALVAVLLLLLTHCITTIRYSVQRFCDRRHKGKEPSTLPYILPGVGSALSLIRNPHGFFNSIVYVCLSLLCYLANISQSESRQW